MTICIGAIASSGQGSGRDALVVASDRMVTFGGMTEFEHKVPKISVLTPHVVVLSAGNSVRAAEVIGRVRGTLPEDAKGKVARTAQAIAEAYIQGRHQAINEEIFFPRGVAMSQFYREGLQQAWLPQLSAAIDQQVGQYDFAVEMMVAGAGPSGAELHAVMNPGVLSDHTGIGFHAIGSGFIHAYHSLIGFHQHPDASLEETVFSVYAAKRRAEVAPGVGKETDMLVIRPAGIRTVNDEELAQVDKLYTELSGRNDHTLQKELEKVKGFAFNA